MSIDEKGKVSFKDRVLDANETNTKTQNSENSYDLVCCRIKLEPVEMKSIDISLSLDPDPLMSSLGFTIQARELLREI